MFGYTLGYILVVRPVHSVQQGNKSLSNQKCWGDVGRYILRETEQRIAVGFKCFSKLEKKRLHRFKKIQKSSPNGVDFFQ